MEKITSSTSLEVGTGYLPTSVRRGSESNPTSGGSDAMSTEPRSDFNLEENDESSQISTVDSDGVGKMADILSRLQDIQAGSILTTKNHPDRPYEVLAIGTLRSIGKQKLWELWGGKRQFDIYLAGLSTALEVNDATIWVFYKDLKFPRPETPSKPHPYHLSPLDKILVLFQEGTVVNQEMANKPEQFTTTADIVSQITTQFPPLGSTWKDSSAGYLHTVLDVLPWKEAQKTYRGIEDNRNGSPTKRIIGDSAIVVVYLNKYGGRYAESLTTFYQTHTFVSDSPFASSQSMSTTAEYRRQQRQADILSQFRDMQSAIGSSIDLSLLAAGQVYYRDFDKGVWMRIMYVGSYADAPVEMKAHIRQQYPQREGIPITWVIYEFHNDTQGLNPHISVVPIDTMQSKTLIRKADILSNEYKAFPKNKEVWIEDKDDHREVRIVTMGKWHVVSEQYNAHDVWESLKGIPEQEHLLLQPEDLAVLYVVEPSRLYVWAEKLDIFLHDYTKYRPQERTASGLFYGWLNPQGQGFPINTADTNNNTHSAVAWTLVYANPALTKMLPDSSYNSPFYLLLRLGWLRVYGNTIEVSDLSRAQSTLIEYVSGLSSDKTVVIDAGGDHRMFRNPQEAMEAIEQGELGSRRRVADIVGEPQPQLPDLHVGQMVWHKLLFGKSKIVYIGTKMNAFIKYPDGNTVSGMAKVDDFAIVVALEGVDPHFADDRTHILPLEYFQQFWVTKDPILEYMENLNRAQQRVRDIEDLDALHGHGSKTADILGIVGIGDQCKYYPNKVSTIVDVGTYEDMREKHPKNAITFADYERFHGRMVVIFDEKHMWDTLESAIDHKVTVKTADILSVVQDTLEYEIWWRKDDYRHWDAAPYIVRYAMKGDIEANYRDYEWSSDAMNATDDVPVVITRQAHHNVYGMHRPYVYLVDEFTERFTPAKSMVNVHQELMPKAWSPAINKEADIIQPMEPLGTELPVWSKDGYALRLHPSPDTPPYFMLHAPDGYVDYPLYLEHEQWTTYDHPETIPNYIKVAINNWMKANYQRIQNTKEIFRQDQ